MLGNARSFCGSFFTGFSGNSVASAAGSLLNDLRLRPDAPADTEEEESPLAGPGNGVISGGGARTVASNAGVAAKSVFHGLSTFKESERKARVCDEIRRNSTSIESERTERSAV